MKKAVCLVLLVTVLIFMHMSALADLGYVSVKAVMNKSMENGFSATLEEIPDDSTVLVIFDGSDCSVTLFGKNSKNEYEGTIWHLDSVKDVLIQFIAMCANWDGLEDCMRPGYRLEFAYMTEDDFYVIESSEEAEMLVAMMYDYLGL